MRQLHHGQLGLHTNLCLNKTLRCTYSDWFSFQHTRIYACLSVRLRIRICTLTPFDVNLPNLAAGKLIFPKNLFHHSMLASTGLSSRIMLYRTQSGQRFSFLVSFLSYFLVVL